MTTIVKPLASKVLVSEIKNEAKSDSGIILTSAKSVADSASAKVLAIGPDVKTVSVGDVVYLEWSKGNIVEIDGAQRVMVDEEHIAAILEK